MKILLTAILSLCFNAFMGAGLAAAAGLPPVAGAVSLISAGLAVRLPAGLREGVLTEVWTGELVMALRGMMDASWLKGIPDASSLVDNDVIHLIDVGVDPEVLINNTTYPIDIVALEDGDIPISLDRFDTTATPITDDELHAISYDKMGRVKESHANALHDKEFAKAAHALCANSHTASTPVLETSGEADPTTGRKLLVPGDILALKRALDGLGVPSDGRRLVLCPDHINDLLAADQRFKEQYSIDRASGAVGRQFGFEVFEFRNTPVYTSAGAKKAVGATAGEGEYNCSFAFYAKRVFKATGSAKMYYSEAKTDPLYHRSLINFSQYFICMPKKADAGAVLRSGQNAGTDTNNG